LHAAANAFLKLKNQKAQSFMNDKILSFQGVLMDSEPAFRIVFYFSLFSALISAVPLTWAWQPLDSHQLGLLQHAAQVTGRLDTAMQLDALQVARVLAALTHLLGLLGVTHPLQDALAVLRQQVGQGGAEAAAAEYGNGLELCHRSSE
jgi:hypothetical protein